MRSKDCILIYGDVITCNSRNGYKQGATSVAFLLYGGYVVGIESSVRKGFVSGVIRRCLDTSEGVVSAL